jgi:hypothetical protein
MNIDQLIAYWREFIEEGREEGWDDNAYDEYQFGRFLIEKAEAT